MMPHPTLGFKDIEQFPKGLLGTDMHAKRILSLANARLGEVRTGSLAEHAVKRVDRLLSNPSIDLDVVLPHWVRHVVANRPEIRVAEDCADGRGAIMLSLMTGHGRAPPLVWLARGYRYAQTQPQRV